MFSPDTILPVVGLVTAIVTLIGGMTIGVLKLGEAYVAKLTEPAKLALDLARQQQEATWKLIYKDREETQQTTRDLTEAIRQLGEITRETAAKATDEHAHLARDHREIVAALGRLGANNASH
jgi:hypothetical protein